MMTEVITTHGKTVQFSRFVRSYNNRKNLRIVISKDAEEILDLERDHRYMQIEEIEVEPGNKHFCSIDGVLFNIDKTELLFYPPYKINTEYTVPDSVITIEQRAFERTINLRKVTMGRNVTLIKWAAFNQSRIIEIDFNDKLRFINAEAFVHCPNIKKVILPESIEEVGNYAFAHCNIEELILKSKNIKFGKNILYDSIDLERIEVNHPVTRNDIALNFSGSRICHVKTPNTEMNIVGCDHAYAYDIKIKSVKHNGEDVILPFDRIRTDHVWHLVLAISGGCYSYKIETVTDEMDLKYKIALTMLYQFNDAGAKNYINRQAGKITEAYARLNDMNSVRKILWALTPKSFAAVQTVARVKGLSNLEAELKNYNIPTVPNKTKKYSKRPKEYSSTGNEVVTDWHSIIGDRSTPAARRYVVVEKDTENIIVNETRYTSQIEHIEVVPENKRLISVDGVLFTKDMRILRLYPARKKDTEYCIPDGVVRIAEGAFANARFLEKIVMPDSVEAISRLAFYRCHNLYSIKFSKNLINIGATAFGECSSVSELIIPESVENLSYNALWKCSNLKRIVINSKDIDIKPSAISNVASLESIILACPAEQMCNNPTSALEKAENFTEFRAPGICIKMSKTNTTKEKKLESITLNDRTIKFENVLVYNSTVPYIADMILSGDYSKCNIYTPWQNNSMTKTKHAIAITLYKTIGDEKARAYIHRQIKPIIKNLIDSDDIDMIKDILSQTERENIDELIKYAQTRKKTEIQIILEKYKNQHFETKSLKL